MLRLTARLVVLALLSVAGLSACGGGAAAPGSDLRDAGSVACALCDAGNADDAAGPDAGVDGGTAVDPAARPTPDLTRVIYTDELMPNSLVPVDARSTEAYAAGHIPGARSLPVTELRAEVQGVAGQLPALAQVAARLTAAGIARGESLLVYADGSDLAAARLAWSLDVLGHPVVAMLDGGFGAWLAAGGVAEQAEQAGTTPAVDAYPADMGDAVRRVDTGWVTDHLDDPLVLLIDARSSAEYAAGHIPGALHFDWTQNVQGGALLPLAGLQQRHAPLPTQATLVAYCQTGSRAAMAYFVLRYLGFEDVRLYDGSMAAWAADPARPLE